MLLAAVTARSTIYAFSLPDPIFQQRSSRLYAQIALTGLFFGGVLVMGNAALLYMPVATSQMLKVGESTRCWRVCWKW